MTYDYDRRVATDGTDRSTHSTIVEYAVQEMIKKKIPPETAAKTTAKKHSGSENIFFGPGMTLIDPRPLTEALYDRLVGEVIKSIPRMKPGMGHFALDGVVQRFYGWPPKPFVKKVRAKLKELVTRRVGGDPFPNDDRS